VEEVGRVLWCLSTLAQTEEKARWTWQQWRWEALCMVATSRAGVTRWSVLSSTWHATVWLTWNAFLGFLWDEFDLGLKTKFVNLGLLSNFD